MLGCEEDEEVTSRPPNRTGFLGGGGDDNDGLWVQKLLGRPKIQGSIPKISLGTQKSWVLSPYTLWVPQNPLGAPSSPPKKNQPSPNPYG